MATTPKQAWPIPEMTDLRGNVPVYMEALGTAAEKQSVMRFTTVLMRDTTITAPEEGMVAYLTAVDELTIYTGSEWRTWDTTPKTYTPTLTQGVAVSKTIAQNTATFARYMRRGRFVDVALSMAVTGAGTANTEILIGLPWTAAAHLVGQVLEGTSHAFDSSLSAHVVGFVQAASTTTLRMIDVSNRANGLTASSFPGALASPDTIRASFTYEIA